jgi:Zn-finger nucleic acid-binding protein
MKVQAITCPTCGDTIFSRARHDFRYCSCKEVAIDGGADYTKIVFNSAKPEIFEMNVTATKKELYDDWNKREDKLGLIKNDIKSKNQKNSKRQPKSS